MSEAHDRAKRVILLIEIHYDTQIVWSKAIFKYHSRMDLTVI